MSLRQFIFVFPVLEISLQIQVSVDSSTVESVVLHMADPFVSVTGEILRVWTEGKRVFKVFSGKFLKPN